MGPVLYSAYRAPPGRRALRREPCHNSVYVSVQVCAKLCPDGGLPRRSSSYGFRGGGRTGNSVVLCVSEADGVLALAGWLAWPPEHGAGVMVANTRCTAIFLVASSDLQILCALDILPLTGIIPDPPASYDSLVVPATHERAARRCSYPYGLYACFEPRLAGRLDVKDDGALGRATCASGHPGIPEAL